MTPERITVSAEVDAETAKIVEDGLDRFNELHNGPDPTKPLWLICRDEQGNVSGGLKGLIHWDWYVVLILWVEEERRRQGIGQRLLRKAEDAARKHGCRRVRLATMTFQAPEFYRKSGYAEECRLLDVPPGHAYIWMSKHMDVQDTGGLTSPVGATLASSHARRPRRGPERGGCGTTAQGGKQLVCFWMRYVLNRSSGVDLIRRKHPNSQFPDTKLN